MIVLKNKLCRNVIAHRFPTNLVVVFSLEARDRQQATRPKALGV